MGIFNMQQSHQNGSWRSDRRSFGSGTTDRRIWPSDRIGSSESRETADAEADPEHYVPLFISDENGEPDPGEYIAPLRTRRASSISSRILVVVCVAATTTILFASLSSDAARDFFRASFADLIPAPLAATLSSSPRANVPAKIAAEPMPAPEPKPLVRNVTTADLGSAPNTMSATDQPREPVPVVADAPKIEAPKLPSPVIHRLTPSEISAALVRADALIASGDIAAARLVLQRAADSEDGKAAIKLAGTYDPDVLAKLGVHGIVPDPAKARDWYEKAKTFGAPEAAMRLEVLASQHR
jgi:hypothetical protein